MSARIIIENDGERYVANDLTAWIIDGGRAISIENKTDYVSSSFTKLPPVESTDNSEVIARLEAENAKLSDALKPIMECDISFKNSPCGTCWGLNDNCMEERFCGRYSFFKAVRKAQDILAHGCASTKEEK